MKNSQRTEYETRNSILKLLSDDELATVSTAETATHLTNGEEYIDLINIDQGVRKANGSATVMGRVLPRNAVLPSTWSNILLELATFNAAAPHLRA